MIAEYILQALADGALNKEDSEKVMIILAANPVWREKYDRITRQKELLKYWWAAKHKSCKKKKDYISETQ